MTKKYDESGSGEITPLELKIFFNDIKTNPFFAQELDLKVQKAKYKKHFNLQMCQDYCHALSDLMKQHGIEIQREVIVTPDGIKKIAEALGTIPPASTTVLPEKTLDENDGTYVGQVNAEDK